MLSGIMSRKETEMNENAVKPLSWREKICYGFGGMGNAIVLQMVSAFLIFFYTDKIGLNAGIVGTILLASKIFDGISDLVMGRIVDKTDTKYGKARVWLLWLCVPYAISGVLLFLVQSSWPEALKYVYVFITYNLTSTILFTGACVPYNAMNALLTADQYERGVLGTTNVLGNVAGQLLVNSFMLKLVASFGDNQTGWVIAAAIFGVIGIAAHMICFTQTAEKNNVSSGSGESEPGFGESVKSLFKNKYWLMVTGMAVIQYFFVGIAMSGAMYFAKLVIGDEGRMSILLNPLNYAQIVMYFLSFYIIRKLGKGGSFRIGFFIAAIGCIMQIFVGGDVTMLTVCAVVKGIGIGMAACCLGGMISDTIEYGEWKTGVRCVGVGNAANTFGQKIGNGIGTAAVGWLLAAAAYDGTVTAASVRAAQIIFTYIPIACCVGIAVIACFYNLDKIYPQIMAELEERRAAKAAE